MVQNSWSHLAPRTGRPPLEMKHATDKHASNIKHQQGGYGVDTRAQEFLARPGTEMRRTESTGGEGLLRKILTQSSLEELDGFVNQN